MQPHRRQPTRLPRPWDSPDKNTGVGCDFLLQCMKVKSESEVALIMSESSWPHGLQPTRLLHPWDLLDYKLLIDFFIGSLSWLCYSRHIKLCCCYKQPWILSCIINKNYSHSGAWSDRGSVFHSPSSRGKGKLELNTTIQMLLPKSDRTHFHSFQMSKDQLFNQQGTASYPEIQDLGTLNIVSLLMI